MFAHVKPAAHFDEGVGKALPVSVVVASQSIASRGSV